MTTNRFFLKGMRVFAAGLICACSGGNVDVSVEGPDFGPLPASPGSEPIIAYGEITGLSGITINDVSYQTSSATVTVNGEPASLSDLGRGQIVTVRGRAYADSRTGTADSIRFDANVVGPVESIDADNRQLIVMGQAVTTNPATRFGAGIDPATYAGLAPGNTLQVSGYAEADGSIRATRIDFATAGAELQVIGRVRQLDLANLLFRVNRLTVDYGSTLLIDLPGGAPSEAMNIRATGTLVDGILKVERLLAAPTLDGVSGGRVQAAGVITRYRSMTDFDLNDWAAGADAGTVFVNGDVGDLGPDTLVILEGQFTADDRILADRITLGHIVSQTTKLFYDFRDFTEVWVPTVFNVNVSYGADYSVEVYIDRGYEHRIDVTQSGSRLRIALLSGNGTIETLYAVITMPILNRIDLDGVVNASLENFDQSQMTMNVGGVSFLRGNALSIDHLTATVSGVSGLELGDIRPLGAANVDISGVSQATLNMDLGSTIMGALRTGQGTGVSTLFYYGTNVNIDVTADANSSIIRLGDTKP